MTKKLDNKSTNNKHCKAFSRFFLLIFKMKLSQIDKDILRVPTPPQISSNLLNFGFAPQISLNLLIFLQFVQFSPQISSNGFILVDKIFF